MYYDFDDKDPDEKSKNFLSPYHHKMGLFKMKYFGTKLAKDRNGNTNSAISFERKIVVNK